MAQINFPNPALQTPPNTFSPDSTPASTKNGVTYKWNGVGWRLAGDSDDPGGGASVTISETAPGGAEPGDLWWDSGAPASLFIYYQDADSRQWVPATPQTDNWYVNGGELVTAQTGINVNVTGTFKGSNPINTFLAQSALTDDGTHFRSQDLSPSTSDIKYHLFCDDKDEANRVYISTDAEINTDGDIVAAGNILAGGYPNSDGARISAIGSVTTRRDDGTQVFEAYQGGLSGDERTVQINADGTATFSGAVSIGGDDASNAMAVYKEGTWAPNFRGSGTAGDYNQSGTVGTYTRIGNVVNVWGQFKIDSVTSNGTNTPWITGTPYTVSETVTSSGICGILTTSADGVAGTIYLARGGAGNGFYVRQQTSAGDGNFTMTAFKAGETFYFYATYPTDDPA